MKNKASNFFPPLAEFFFVASLIRIAFKYGGNLLNDGDTGYHIRAGEWILQHQSIPKSDPFSFHTPALPWTAHEWLSEVIMALIHRMGGMTAIVLFFAFLLSVIYYITAKQMEKRTSNLLAVVVFTLLAIVPGQLHWLARPHIFSLLLGVLFYGILESYQNKEDRRGLYFLPPLMVLWANLHGGFLLGIILIGSFLAGNMMGAFFAGSEKEKSAEKIKPLVLILLASLAAVCNNPYGPALLKFPFFTICNKTITNYVTEFLAPNFHEQPLFLFYLLLTMIILGASTLALTFTEVILIFIFGYMALFSQRHITLFALFSAPILLKQTRALYHRISWAPFKERFEGFSKRIQTVDRGGCNYLWMIVSVILVAVAARAGKIHYDFDPAKAPVKAVEFLLQQKPEGHMFNDDEFGDYAIYAAWPTLQVFIDGRSDMYGDEIVKDYMKVITLQQDWEEILGKFQIEWALIRADAPLATLLQRSGWKSIYSDSTANILVKGASN